MKRPNSIDCHQPRETSFVKILHGTVKGRGRYKVQGLFGSNPLKRYLEFNLSLRKGIKTVQANPNTGNILLHFHKDKTTQEIAILIDSLVQDYYRSPKEFAQLFYQQTMVILNTSVPWHLKEIDTIVAELNTSTERGLSHADAQTNLRQYGSNALTEAEPRSGLSIFLDYFKSVPVALLSGAALLSVLTGGIADAIVIMGVVSINAILGYVTESNSERIINSLKHFINPSAWVLREGQLIEINSQDLAVGDILLLQPGSYVPADARLIEADRLSIDESALTGESLPIRKHQEILASPQETIPLAERKNMVYRGTFVTGGQGRGVIVSTGNSTEMGQIQSLVGETSQPSTPMERQLEQAGSQLVLLSSVVCALVFAIGLLRGYGLLEMVKSSISLAVAAVPEGLPTVATTTLALGILNMRKQKVLIRRLEAIEALGSIQALCLDKTGTLTANRMTVLKVCWDGRETKLADGHFWVDNQEINPYSCDELLKLIHIAVLCNDSQINTHQDGTYIIDGSATENALIEMAIAAGVTVADLNHKYPRLLTYHRSTEHNFMATVHRIHESAYLMAVKGNPSEVLDRCSTQMRNGQPVELTEADRQAIEEQNESLAGQALRVLGIAYSQGETADIESLPVSNLIWVGLIGMADPIRPGVTETIADFHTAGINTLMITGDQSPTAYAIGKELNLSQGQPLKILDSTELTDLSPDVLAGLSEQVHIFARISPAHKLQIVQALQQRGLVVAMTGDGINDTPALKAAEVGIAMGHTGTDVAREVADVVLEDDNLQTMIIAVSQGRTIYNNIRKSVHFLLSTNLSEIIVMLFATTGGLGQPLNAMQLLWLNLVTDIFPGLALALEAPEPDVLTLPPRSPDEPIIKSSDFRRIVWESTALSVSSLAAYGYGIARYGISPHASTIAFMSLVSGQLLHALSCRSSRPLRSQQLPPNPYLTGALAGSMGLQWVSLATPGLRNLLHLTPLNLADSLVIGGSAILPLIINEGTKPQ
ncbi:ATPase, P-type (transporting), HAD superfamily, subfamily IC [Rippkaea orientalis PCC 8801]|uniref:ATPase, P-type (Transporting), HAD superfamily, subfamily IC n=1 Tax=Rippkaea orientalis (strain PCC 8801 / RF-1) TaxID=41431 RepID=B7JWE5_RIPO1|nr:HAD-IC family P-type ATPase [Rippkaea orientalis]ACK66990.1 ATPase, P-type (transporting), HAD superfamily, subfamily IC [Rippkaea orientalis PCC 8801]